MTPTSLRIKEPTKAFENYNFPLRVSGGTPVAPLFYWKLSGELVEQTKPTPEQTFTSSLRNPKKVKFYVAPFGNPIVCVVFGRTPTPRLGDTSTLKWFSKANLQPIDSTIATLAPGFSGDRDEMEIGPDYRYFTPYVLSNVGTPMPFYTYWSFVQNVANLNMIISGTVDP